MFISSIFIATKTCCMLKRLIIFFFLRIFCIKRPGKKLRLTHRDLGVIISHKCLKGFSFSLKYYSALQRQLHIFFFYLLNTADTGSYLKPKKIYAYEMNTEIKTKKCGTFPQKPND